MYRRIDDFIADWNIESEATYKVFKALTDESLNQRVMPDGRSLGEIAWHITLAINAFFSQVGIEIDSPEMNASVPTSAEEIAEAYKKSATSVAVDIVSKWMDDNLPDELTMFGRQWKKGIVLMGVITHQAHHRGQMTVLMRQAGLAVPGVYGPSKEEWAAMGSTPMK